MVDIAPVNELIYVKYNIDMIHSYIDKYPEDAEKWRQFVKEQDDIRRYRENDYVEADDTTIKTLIEGLENPNPVDVTTEEGCLICRKRWDATVNHPTITLLCGHKYHTLCFLERQYTNDVAHCIVLDCTIDTDDILRKISRTRESNTRLVITELTNVIVSSPEFNSELKDIKSSIHETRKAHVALNKLFNETRKKVIEKHEYSIKHIQRDMNEAIKDINNSNEYKTFKISLRKYRLKERMIYLRNRISLRDLRSRNLVRVGGNLRWILERHRPAIYKWKFGIRIYPGRNRL